MIILNDGKVGGLGFWKGGAPIRVVDCSIQFLLHEVNTILIEFHVTPGEWNSLKQNIKKTWDYGLEVGLVTKLGIAVRVRARLNVAGKGINKQASFLMWHIGGW